MLQILVPLDGSTLAEESLKHAVAIAEIFSAELLLLRIIAEPDAESAIRMDSVDYALCQHQAKSYLDDLQHRYSTPNLTIRYEVAEGHPAETIVQYMTTKKPDLLILTRYGRGNAQDFATGGTAQKVLSCADCSVLLLDPCHPISPQNGYENILVPVDDGKDSDCAVAVAAMIAEIHHASVTLLQVTQEPQQTIDLPDTRHARELVEQMHRLIRGEAERRLRDLAAKMPTHIKVETRALMSTDIPLAIESTAEDLNSDLLLLHANDTGQLQQRRYDSVNQALVLYSHRPLFILRPPAGEGLASNFRSVYLDEQRFQAS